MNETAQLKGYGLFQRGKGGKWYCIARTEGGNCLAGAERILEAKAWPLYAPSIGKRRLSLYTGLDVQYMEVKCRQKNYAGGHEMAPVFIQTPEEQEAFEAFERMEFARQLVTNFPHRSEAYLSETFPDHAVALKEVFACRSSILGIVESERFPVPGSRFPVPGVLGCKVLACSVLRSPRNENYSSDPYEAPQV